MKFFITTIFLFLCSYDGFGQVINGDFEEWNGDSPVGWRSQLGFGSGKSQDSYSGEYSLHIYSPPSNDVFLDNNIRSNYLGGFRIPKDANQISCWYKGNLNYEIYAIFDLAIGFSQNGIQTKVLQGGLDSSYKWNYAVLSTFQPVSDSTHDSIALTFRMGSSGPIGYFSFDIDGVKFDTIVKSVRQNGNSSRKIISISPNPIKNIAYANYSVLEQSHIEMFLYTVDGKKLKDLSAAESVYGSGRIPIDLYDIPNGFYYILCRINGEIVTKPVIISR
jgi:hypothetical protein